MSFQEKILSFDVGIKNLAYCLMTKNADDTVTVKDWNIIKKFKKVCSKK